jgi:hypothetical protein
LKVVNKRVMPTKIASNIVGVSPMMPPSKGIQKLRQAFKKRPHVRKRAPINSDAADNPTLRPIRAVGQISKPAANKAISIKDSAKANQEYYAFIVQNAYGSWRFARVNNGSMDCYNCPYLFPKSSLPEMIEIWKRVVIDNAVPWDETVVSTTLRIISYSIGCQDSTDELLEGSEDAQALKKRSAMARLTDAEAKMLGLETEKATQVLFSEPDLSQHDMQILRSLADDQLEFNLEEVIKVG